MSIEDDEWLDRLTEAGVTSEQLTELGELLLFGAVLVEAGESGYLAGIRMDSPEKAKLIHDYLEHLKRNLDR